MTDVTGFGLAGHLAGLCQASGVGAVVRLRDVPLMDGALALAEKGVRSTIYSDNRADPRITAPDMPRAALMFDPQTCGGLLAAVPRERATALAKAHPDRVWIIGRFDTDHGVRFTED